MKRAFFIIGIIIILLLCGVLAFLLIASDEQKQDVFSAFNFGDTTDPTVDIGAIVDTFTEGESEPLTSLRQLSLKRVIGATEINISSSTNKIIYYAEAGTGHIYSLDIESGNENRLSNITIPTASDASIATDGSLALVVASGGTDGRQATLITLPHDGIELSSIALNERIKDYTLTRDGVVLYSTIVGESLTGRRFDPSNNETTTLFTLPFREAIVRFNPDNPSSTYVYIKPAQGLEGYVYAISGGTLQRLPVAGYNFSALTDNDQVLATRLGQSGLYSTLYLASNKTEQSMPFVLLPEKCLFVGNGANIFCGVDIALSEQTVIDWYKGITASNDDLWLIDPDSGEATFIASPVELSGRQLDLTKPSVNETGDRYYFINKADESLWVYDTTLMDNQ